MKTSGKHTLLVAGISLLAVVVLVVTDTHVVWYRTFYQYQLKPTGSAALKVLLIACCGVLTLAVMRQTLRAWQFLLLGLILGTATQFGFAYTEGLGFDGIRGRALAGHGQFIADALASDDAAYTLRNYESLAARGKLGVFPRTKPPGTLLFYILTERVSRLVVAHTYDEDKRKNRFVDFLAMVWPFVATLAILPLYWMATMLRGPTEARVAVGLYLLVPSFNLITLHTDQVLFPFLFVLVLALFVWSLGAQQGVALIVRGVMAGAALWLAVFCDFPLAVASVLCAGLWLADVVTDSRPYAARFRTTSMLAGAVMVGFLVPSILLWMTVQYNPIVRWHAALAFHAAWRKVPTVLPAEAGLSNIAEFIDWTGVPITLLALAVFWVGRAGRGSGAERGSLPHMALVALVMCLAGYLAFFSRTVAEIARLWLFLMPVMCLVAARTLSELRKTNRLAVPIMFALQFATVYLIKVTHDFW